MSDEEKAVFKASRPTNRRRKKEGIESKKEKEKKEQFSERSLLLQHERRKLNTHNYKSRNHLRRRMFTHDRAKDLPTPNHSPSKQTERHKSINREEYSTRAMYQQKVSAAEWGRKKERRKMSCFVLLCKAEERGGEELFFFWSLCGSFTKWNPPLIPPPSALQAKNFSKLSQPPPISCDRSPCKACAIPCWLVHRFSCRSWLHLLPTLAWSLPSSKPDDWSSLVLKDRWVPELDVQQSDCSSCGASDSGSIDILWSALPLLN